MRRITIGELEQFTQIKAHTIRIWESRYQLINPQRRNTTRFYSIEELALFLDIALLNSKGFKISSIEKMGADAIKEKIGQLTDEETVLQKTVFDLIHAMYAIDIIQFEHILDRSIDQFGYVKLMEQVIIPFIEKVKLFSYNDSSIQTHFVVTALRKKIMLAIEQLPLRPAGKTALLFLPKGEHFDLLLLYMAWEIRKAGVHVLYLGTNITKVNLADVIQLKSPDFFYTYITSSASLAKENFASVFHNEQDRILYAALPDQSQVYFDDHIKYIYYRDLRQFLAKTTFTL